MQVEFARQSDNGRITLVLDSTAPEVTSLWARMSIAELDAAKAALLAREGMGQKRRHQIGAWTTGDPQPELIGDLRSWTKARQVDAVIWTALPTRFNRIEPNTPTEDQVLAYLASLEGQRRQDAETYIRRAPRQIDTPYRKAIERVLNWTYEPQ